MFGELVGIVNLLRGAIEQFRKTAKAANREQVALKILKVYFILKDVVDEGEALAIEAGPKPLATLNALEGGDALAVLRKWNRVLDRQKARLMILNANLVGQRHLEIIDPELSVKLDQAIGSKADRAFTLHGLGSKLFFRNMFEDYEGKIDTANYVLAMSGVEGDSSSMNLDRIRAEISELREGLDRYRSAVRALVSSEELVSLSKKAREETELPI